MLRLARVIHPWRWIDWFTFETNFKVERGLVNATATTDTSDDLAWLHPVAKILGQTVVVTI